MTSLGCPSTLNFNPAHVDNTFSNTLWPSFLMFKYLPLFAAQTSDTRTLLSSSLHGSSQVSDPGELRSVRNPTYDTAYSLV